MSSLRLSTQVLRSLTIGLAVAVAVPVQAAEQINLDFGPFSRSVPVNSLVTFTETGEADAELATLLRRLSPEQQEGLRTALTTSRPVDIIPMTQWLYDPMGERSLLFLGKLVQTEARLNGQQALRSAAITAVAEDGTLSLLDVIRHFPTRTLHLDMAQILQNTRQVLAEAEATQAVVEAVRQASTTAATQPPHLDLATLPDLTQPGPHGSRQISLVLEDASRDRTYPAEIVVPADLERLTGPIPIVVISHGLGDSPQSFLDIAAHVASHGFVVALPEHIGSNFTQKQALLSGLDQEGFKAQDFIDRPLDVSFLLDELARRNATIFGGQLNVNQVAVVGHSFGGYTALALGGATVDFNRLAQRCAPNANIILDAAMLLECRALELQDQPAVVQQLGEVGVRDERVKLVMAFATVSNLFGPQGMSRLQSPVMIFGGALDIIAPVVPQQVSAFSWLNTPDRYLYLAENTSHGSDFTRSISNLLNFDDDFEQSVDEALGLTRSVNKSLIVAFAQVYGANRSEYAPFLSSDYIEAVSAEPFRLHLVRAVPPSIANQLEAAPPE